MKLLHIINPVEVAQGSDLKIAQPITFESLIKAREFSKNMNIQLVTAQYQEDLEIIPDILSKSKNLKKSVKNIGNNELTRKLPLIKDILKRAYNLSKKGDYIIYSNVDIAVMPFFYNWIEIQINLGYDAFVVNRRTISNKYKNPKELDLMYSEIGEIHPGYDCFVFKRDLYKKLILGNICVGAVYIGLALFINLKLIASKFEEFGTQHLTFHIGNDQVWRKEEHNAYAKHNQEEFEKIKLKLARKYRNVVEIVNSAFPNAGKENDDEI
jgi:hypothetical protein